MEMKLRNGHGGLGQIALLFIGLCAAALMLAGFRGGAGAGAAESAAALEQPLKQLAAAGAALTEEGTPLRLVLKWQGTYAGEGTAAEKAAADLAQRLELGGVQAEEEDGHATYRAAATSEASGRVSLFWSELDGGGSYVIVTHETDRWLPEGGLVASAEATGRLLQAAGIQAEWNASLQGKAAVQDAPAAALAAMEPVLAAAFGSAQAEESYTDETTASRSYSVPGMERTVASAGHDIAVQAAVHRNSSDGTNRVTVGLPLITIEY